MGPLKKNATDYHGTFLGIWNQTNFSSTKRCFCKTKIIQEKVLIFFFLGIFTSLPGNWVIFLLCLFKVSQKYSDGQNDPEKFHISSAFPMAGLVLLWALSQTPDYGCHHRAPFSEQHLESIRVNIKMPAWNLYFFKFFFNFILFKFASFLLEQKVLNL